MSAVELPEGLRNLLTKTRPPALKEAIVAPAHIEAYLQNAADALTGARVEGVPTFARFVTAYEGLFAVAMGTLGMYGLRPGDGEGHRSISLQAVVTTLGLSKANSNAVAQVIRTHDTRNGRIYRAPIPPISDARCRVGGGVARTGTGGSSEAHGATSASKRRCQYRRQTGQEVRLGRRKKARNSGLFHVCNASRVTACWRGADATRARSSVRPAAS